MTTRAGGHDSPAGALPGDDLSWMGSKVEWVRTEALMRHREFVHGPGESRGWDWHPFAPKHTPEQWEAAGRSVRDLGIRAPLHLLTAAFRALNRPGRA